MVSPWTLEPHHLRARSHKGLGITLVRRIRIEPHLNIGTKERAHLELAPFLPLFAVIVIVIIVVSIRVNAYSKRFPVLEIRHILVPSVAIPAITFVCRNRRRSRSKHRIVGTTCSTQNMQIITVF